MLSVSVVSISNVQYYSAIELASYDPSFFGNINRRADILKKNKYI